MPNSIIPFDYNPDNVKIVKDGSTYTCPANTHAIVQVMPKYADARIRVKKSGGSSEYAGTQSTSQATFSGTVAQGTYTLLTPTGSHVIVTNITGSISSSNGSVDVKYNGTTFFTIPQNGTNTDATTRVFEGANLFQYTANGTGNTSGLSITMDYTYDGDFGLVAFEVYLSAGDEIQYFGHAIVINEFNNPS